MVNLIKHACLEFDNPPIQFNQNKIDRDDILGVNEKLLISIQSVLNKNGAYDAFYGKHEDKSLYIRPLFDFVANKSTIAANKL